jgi:hypothetical protein
VELKELGIRIDCTLPVRVGRHLARLFLPGRLLFGIRVGDAATLTMLAVKKSMKRSAAASPRSAAMAGTTIGAYAGLMTASAVGFSGSS